MKQLIQEATKLRDFKTFTENSEETVTEVFQSQGFERADQAIERLAIALKPGSNLNKGLNKDLDSNFDKEFKQMQKHLDKLSDIWYDITDNASFR